MPPDRHQPEKLSLVNPPDAGEPSGPGRVAMENVTKIFPGPKGARIQAVANLNLNVAGGELLALVGPSGCGKSTTLRLIAGLEEMTEGTVSIDGRVVNQLAPKDRDIAMVFQNHALYPHMTAYENMAFGLKARKYSRNEIEERVAGTAEILGLKDCLDRKPEALSGGQRQRVAVGRAMVRKPSVFLFDEPLSNLDVQLRAQMRREISRLHARLGATMIYVTHDQIEAMSLGDRIAVMREGVIQQVAEPMTIYRRPANLFVAGFIGSPPMNLFRGTLTQKVNGIFFQEDTDSGTGFTVRLADDMTARFAGWSGKKIVLGLRPEDISDKPADPAAGRNVEAAMESIEPTGPETHIYVTTGAHAFVIRASADAHATAGGRITLAFDMCRAHFFDPGTEMRLNETD